MTDNPAVVAVGYNRPDSLLRLLEALRRATYSGATPLVVSLDHSGDLGPGEVADRFDWPHGPKRVIRHPERLGLRNHILSCGDLTQEYGGIVLFEDDIVPSSHFQAFVRQAIGQYGHDDRIGGIGLYSYRINEFNNIDFEPIDDGTDVFFLQVASSWGQAWTAGQWRQFRDWYARNKDQPFAVADGIPRQLEAWRDNSWKRFYIKYLVATGRYFVFPRSSLSTNMATPGTNTKRVVSIYQTPLDLAPRDWLMPTLDASRARYDVFFEPEAESLCALNPALGEPDFDVDLYGVKPEAALRRPRLLSARKARGGKGFGLVAGAPPVASVLQGKPGDFFHLAPRGEFGGMGWQRKLALARACQVGRPLNALMFQTLKPLQTEMMIARKRRAGSG